MASDFLDEIDFPQQVWSPAWSFESCRACIASQTLQPKLLQNLNTLVSGNFDSQQPTNLGKSQRDGFAR